MRVGRTARRKRERGAALIEFALTLPFLTFLMLGTIQYGHYFWITLNAVEAAKVGLAGAVTQQTTTSATNCTDTLVTDKAHIVEVAGVAAANAYFTTNASSLLSYATPTVTCISAPVNGATLPTPSWQIVVKMDFPPVIGFRLPWMRASTTLTGGITYSTPALIRTN
jgi:Flp pilus assembly protein TadG